MTAQLPVVRWTNAHLSVSRIRRFEECPLAFYKQYVNRPEGAQRELSEPAEFGTVAHAALERVYRWIIDDEYAGPFPEEKLLEAFRLAWTESGLSGVDLYTEGRLLLRQYAQWAGPVDHLRVLAVEREFHLLIGPGVCRLIGSDEESRWTDVDDFYVVNGFIDRVDRVDSKTVEVVDFKTGRLLFTKDELAADLQLGVYAIVAKLFYPWAERVELSFHMMRHGPIRQRAERSAEDLDAVQDYLRAVGAKTERGPYPPRLNAHCGSCDWRDGCDAYRDALGKKLALVAVGTADLPALAQERERVAAIAKAAYARKETLDAVLRAAVGDRESLELGGYVYRVLQFSNTEYPVADLLALFREEGVDLTSALAVDNKALDALLDGVEADENQPRMVRDFLRARCAARAVRVPQKPRIDSKVSKKR
jgi:putative RecB family exonuclease